MSVVYTSTLGGTQRDTLLFPLLPRPTPPPPTTFFNSIVTYLQQPCLVGAQTWSQYRPKPPQNAFVFTGSFLLFLAVSLIVGLSLALSNTDILKEDTMNFERIAGPFPVPTVTGKSGGCTTGIPAISRINAVSVAVWKPLARI